MTMLSMLILLSLYEQLFFCFKFRSHALTHCCSFSAFVCLKQPEHQQLIVDAGALPHLVDLLKRHKNGCNTRAVNGVIRKAADAITNLSHENGCIKTRVRFACFLTCS